MPGGPHGEARTPTPTSCDRAPLPLSWESRGQQRLREAQSGSWKNGSVGLHSSGTCFLARETMLNSVCTHVKVSESKSQGDSPDHTWTKGQTKGIHPLSFNVFLPIGLGAAELSQATVVPAFLR